MSLLDSWLRKGAPPKAIGRVFGQLLSYLAERNIAIFSTDIDLRDFTMHEPEQVIKSVMAQLEKHGKGIILMHDLRHATAEAMPELGPPTDLWPTRPYFIVSFFNWGRSTGCGTSA